MCMWKQCNEGAFYLAIKMKMKKYVPLIFLSIVIANNLIAQTNMKNPWFQNKNCASLEIKKYKSISNHDIIKSVKIDDAKFIQSLMERIEKIPPDGDRMKSFGGGAEQIDLVFYSGDKAETIQIFEKSFKTPSTGFNSKNEIETNLYNEIDAILFHGINKIISE